MRVIEDVRNTTASFPNLALTIGSFDGIHLGHQRIIGEVIQAARAMNGTAAVMSLRPHPRQFFAPQNAPNILMSDEKKEEVLDELGVDVLFVLPFDAAAASMPPESFLREIVVDRCHAKTLIVGHDFSFGKNAAGDFSFLQEQAAAYGYEIRQTPQVVIDGERVSSTLIRERILQGEVDRIAPLLGRKYAIVGEVISGRGVGAKLGVPTANITPHHSAVPAQGVYIAQAHVDGILYPAAVNIGVAPTIRNEDIVIEAHLLDYSGDLVGKRIEIIFHKRLRPEKKFPSIHALIEAINEDVAAIRRYFSN